MEFTNTTIPIENLPAITDVEFKQLERQYLKVERISFFIGIFILLAILIAAFLMLTLPVWVITIAITVFLMIATLGWIADTLGYNYSGYALREKDVLYRSGWFIQKTRVVPLNRVLHVSVQSGPIERRFNLASVSIFTAGSGSADFTIKGITDETANQIKDWLTEQLNGTEPTQ